MPVALRSATRKAKPRYRNLSHLHFRSLGTASQATKFTGCTAWRNFPLRTQAKAAVYEFPVLPILRRRIDSELVQMTRFLGAECPKSELLPTKGDI